MNCNIILTDCYTLIAFNVISFVGTSRWMLMYQKKKKSSDLDFLTGNKQITFTLILG